MISKDSILKLFSLEEENVLSIFPYGSRVYKTCSPSSDYDFIVVVSHGENDFAIDRDNLSLHIFKEGEFQNQINAHHISALECLFLPQEIVLKNAKTFSFSLDKDILRKSISQKSSHSFVKAKKKFEVDKNIYIGKKSLFHSLRIADFGLQIAAHGKIVNFSSCNDLWDEIRDDKSEDWSTYKDKYQSLLNSKMSEFRKFAPKGK